MSANTPASQPQVQQRLPVAAVALLNPQEKKGHPALTTLSDRGLIMSEAAGIIQRSFRRH